MNVFAVYRKILRISSAVIGKPSLPNFFIAPKLRTKITGGVGRSELKNVDKIKIPIPSASLRAGLLQKTRQGWGTTHIQSGHQLHIKPNTSMAG